MSAPHAIAKARASLLAGLAFALTLPSARAQEKPLGTVQDLVFFGGNRPVLLRLHLLRDGKPLSTGRDAYIKRWFDYFDRDGDGVLNQAEARVVPTPPMLQQLRFNGILLLGRNIVRRNDDAQPRLDKNGDGKVTPDELTAYFERAGFRSVDVQDAGSPQRSYDRPSEMLFKHLDAQKRGKLSKDGVRQAADALLRTFDTNDDEMVVPEELDPNLGSPQILRAPVPVLQRGRPMTNTLRRVIYSVNVRGRDEQLALLLGNHFCKDRSVQVNQAKSGLERAAFDRLDRNRDGVLDLDELACWHQRPADVELVIQMNTGRGARSTVEVKSSGSKPAGVEQRSDGMLRLTFGDAQLSIRLAEAIALGRVINARARVLLQVFQLADTRKNGFITAKDLTGRFEQILRPVFPLADRNGDGKLTLSEMTALVDLLEEAPRSSVNLSVTEHGRALFQLLDTNRDGRLGLRELRAAWERLGPLDKNGDGLIAVDEIPRQFDLTVGQGSPGQVRVPAGLGRRLPTIMTRRIAVGPLWFRKMDLNGDGDVSPREFLGTAAEFRQIDSNADGLISVEEAEAYDGRLRGKRGRGLQVR